MNKLPKQKSVRLYFFGTLMGALGLFVACGAYLAIALGSYTAADALAYQKLVSGSDDDALAKDGHASRQQRGAAQKDLLLAEKHGRLAVRLCSARSELALDQRAGSIAVVEHMQEVSCLMQEELLAYLPDGRKAVRQADGRFLLEKSSPALPDAWLPADAPQLRPMQVIRRLEAKTATYNYKDDTFMAENVTVERYLAAGHVLDAAVDQMQPLMKGVAEFVDFTLKGNERNFRAHHLKATFYDQGKL